MDCWLEKRVIEKTIAYKLRASQSFNHSASQSCAVCVLSLFCPHCNGVPFWNDILFSDILFSSEFIWVGNVNCLPIYVPYNGMYRCCWNFSGRCIGWCKLCSFISHCSNLVQGSTFLYVVFWFTSDSEPPTYNFRVLLYEEPGNIVWIRNLHLICPVLCMSAFSSSRSWAGVVSSAKVSWSS